MDRRLHSLVLVWFRNSISIRPDCLLGRLLIGPSQGDPSDMFWRKHKVRGRKLPNRYALRGREVISTEDCKVEQPMGKMLARHPLVLLDHQLKNLAKEG
jgi:hypothetical protein